LRVLGRRELYGVIGIIDKLFWTARIHLALSGKTNPFIMSPKLLDSVLLKIVLLGGSLTERNLARNAHPEESLLLPAHSAMKA
jgi:hypothetical protein